MFEITVSLLPDLLNPHDLRHRSVVVIDVLRASTTIIHALVNGASQVIPCETIEQAQAAAEKYPASERLLGGERGGVQIEGFDLGNSPFSYSADVVSGKTVIFTTTNGTYALQKCGQAEEVLIGSFANLSAIVAQLLAAQRSIHLLCAGTNREMTAEDILYAGAVVHNLLELQPEKFACHGVQAQLALDFYGTRGRDHELFSRTMKESLGGQNLISLGMERDIERAMEIDLYDLVPAWDVTANSITPTV